MYVYYFTDSFRGHRNRLSEKLVKHRCIKLEVRLRPATNMRVLSWVIYNAWYYSRYLKPNFLFGG